MIRKEMAQRWTGRRHVGGKVNEYLDNTSLTIVVVPLGKTLNPKYSGGTAQWPLTAAVWQRPAGHR